MNYKSKRKRIIAKRVVRRGRGFVCVGETQTGKKVRLDCPKTYKEFEAVRGHYRKQANSGKTVSIKNYVRGKK